MPACDHRLTTLEVARFVADGYLRFDSLVPDSVNESVLAELPAIEATKFANFGLPLPPEMPAADLPATTTRLSDCYDHSSGIGAMLRLPAVLGIVESLVGPDPIFDHDFVHHLRAGHTNRQHLHPDAIVDTATPDFDIQLFYFPHAVAPGGGGTRFVPGSHLHRVVSASTARYQHIVGEQFYSGPAGTVLVFHHGLWHAGQDNPSDRDRWMYKIRLGPDRPQIRLWNTDDLAEAHNDRSDHIFATPRSDSVAAVLRSVPPWLGTDESRYVLTERARLWRYLSGDPDYDADYYLTRLERRAGYGRRPDPTTADA
jgi:hypothetical protein